MRRISKKVPTLLAAAMALTMLPMTAMAATRSIGADGAYTMAALSVADGDTVNIGAGLTVTLEGDAGTTYANVKIICGAGVSLTLSNVHIDNSAVTNACALSLYRRG